VDVVIVKPSQPRTVALPTFGRVVS